MSISPLITVEYNGPSDKNHICQKRAPRITTGGVRVREGIDGRTGLDQIFDSRKQADLKTGPGSPSSCWKGLSAVLLPENACNIVQ